MSSLEISYTSALPAKRLKQLLESELTFFKENQVDVNALPCSPSQEEKDSRKLRELNKALIEHLRVYYKYGMKVLEQEYRKSMQHERQLKEKMAQERLKREFSIQKEQAEKEKKLRQEKRLEAQQLREKLRKEREELAKEKEDEKKKTPKLSYDTNNCENLTACRPRILEETTRLRNQLGERDLEIKQLKEEIRALKAVERRQARAIKDMDNEVKNLPVQLNSLLNEVSTLKVKQKIVGLKNVGEIAQVPTTTN